MESGQKSMSGFENIAVEIFKKKFRAEKRLILISRSHFDSGQIRIKQNQSKQELKSLIRDYESLILETLNQACN